MRAWACLRWVRLRMFKLILIFSLCAGIAFSSEGIALNGEPKYRPLKHFDYVNPSAPKGGKIKLHRIGSFDSLNPFIIRGSAAAEISLIYDTLMVQALDEPFSEYGLVAEHMERAQDNSYVIFHLDKRARFHDGVGITAEDVKFTFETLMERGNPVFRRYYEDVSEVLVLDSHRVKFAFKHSDNRELPLILGQLAVLPKHFYAGRKFDEDVLRIPMGSGAYRIASFKVGKEIVYERVADYWAKDHPARIGQFNFDRITYEYYKDDTVALEAFRAGAYDLREENSAKNWALGYEGRALQGGEIKKLELTHTLPSGMQGFFFNTRKEQFRDIRVREAIFYAFDFEWSNKHLFFSQYRRTRSFFDNSPFASAAIPTQKERAMLISLGKEGKILDEPFMIPINSGNGNIRPWLLKAQALLKEAGYRMEGGRLVDREGKPLIFELLLVSPMMERLALPFKRNLAILGITMNVRLVDATQYINRLLDFDYDMIVGVIAQSLSPGNEQRYFWHSSSRNERGSRNYAGIADSAIDEAIERLINAHSYEELIAQTRLLDRLLLWGYYVIPHFHSRNFRVAYWDKFARPEVSPRYELGFWSWWIDEEREKSLLGANPRVLRK